MKLLGIMLIFTAASATGFLIAEKYISVLKGIKRAENLLKTIVLGLKNDRMTLSEIFKTASFCNDKKTKLFLENIELKKLDDSAEIAEKCGFCINKTANSVLSEAFFVLGKYSAGEQIKELEFCRNKLFALYEKTEQSYLMKAKLLRYSGVFTGLFAAVILL